MKLNDGQQHLLKLLDKNKDEDGWSKVSDQLYQIVSRMPSDLVEMGGSVGEWKARLTNDGKVLVKWI